MAFDSAMAVALVTDPSTAERRSHWRYDVGLNLRYRVLGRRFRQQGTGRTCNMSKGGICFRADQSLPEGRRVELSIDWPVRLDGLCPLQLRITGTVVRTSEMSTVIKTTRYEFCPRAGASVALRQGADGSIDPALSLTG